MEHDDDDDDWIEAVVAVVVPPILDRFPPVRLIKPRREPRLPRLVAEGVSGGGTMGTSCSS